MPLMVERMFDERIYGTAQWFAGALTLAWRKVEVPTLRVRPDKWISMFRTLGFVTYGEVNGIVDESQRPTEPLTLYRGAPPEYREGLSWTDTPTRARWYVQEWQTGKRNTDGRVWKCTIPPERFLAYFDRDPVEEIEWVADVRGLPIVEHVLCCRDRGSSSRRGVGPDGDRSPVGTAVVREDAADNRARPQRVRREPALRAGGGAGAGRPAVPGRDAVHVCGDRRPTVVGADTGAARHFVVDAWLANWDAPEPGNILIGDDGTAFRVDVGGALDFRARGERRNLTAEVFELETMRDPGISRPARGCMPG
ncbi:hypothetical protein NJ76_29875 [Rhodococcus sp. IITR03]|nr:hypothetical protein NJ76_29875 [Rhodococcus sp. IITR03]